MLAFTEAWKHFIHKTSNTFLQPPLRFLSKPKQHLRAVFWILMSVGILQDFERVLWVGWGLRFLRMYLDPHLEGTYLLTALGSGRMCSRMCHSYCHQALWTVSESQALGVSSWALKNRFSQNWMWFSTALWLWTYLLWLFLTRLYLKWSQHTSCFSWGQFLPH